jgi:hypothetical protein
MATGQKLKKHKKLDPTKGQRNDPTHASEPSAQTYRYPIEKGLAKLNPKLDASGNPVPLTEFGRRYSGPTSVSVADSDQMSDFDIAPTDKDAALESLKSGENNMVADLQLRTVSDQSYPVAGGGSMKRQQNPDLVFGKAKPKPV